LNVLLALYNIDKSFEDWTQVDLDALRIGGIVWVPTNRIPPAPSSSIAAFTALLS